MVNTRISKSKILIGALLASVILIFSSCSEAVTLYATWADGNGNSLMLNAQKKYIAKFVGQEESTEGTYTYNFNTLILTNSSKENTFMEWDIRGYTLYLYYEDENGDDKSLALYRVGDPVNTGEEE